MQVDVIDPGKTAMIVVDMQTISWPLALRWKHLPLALWCRSLPKPSRFVATRGSE